MRSRVSHDARASGFVSDFYGRFFARRSIGRLADRSPERREEGRGTDARSRRGSIGVRSCLHRGESARRFERWQAGVAAGRVSQELLTLRQLSSHRPRIAAWFNVPRRERTLERLAAARIAIASRAAVERAINSADISRSASRLGAILHRRGNSPTRIYRARETREARDACPQIEAEIFV